MVGEGGSGAEGHPRLHSEFECCMRSCFKTKQNKIMYVKKRTKNNLIWFVLEVDSNAGTLYPFDPST